MQQPASHQGMKIQLLTGYANKYELTPRWILFGLWPCRTSLLVATATVLGHKSFGCFCRRLCAESGAWGSGTPVPLSHSWSSWCGSGYMATAGMQPHGPTSCGSAGTRVYAIQSYSESDNALQGLAKAEGGKWEMRKMKDWAWVAFVNKQDLILPS